VKNVLQTRQLWIGLLIAGMVSGLLWVDDGGGAEMEDPTIPEKPWVFHVPLMKDRPEGSVGDAIQWGYDLIMNTQDHLKEFVGNGLNCRNCHLDAGRLPHAGTFVGVYPAYPEYRSRSGSVITLDMRINECFRRSLNGKALPADSPDMAALVSYMAWLSTGIPTGTNISQRGFAPLSSSRPANPKQGGIVFLGKCAGCHGVNGEGTTTAPSVWGPRSYNIGAGMARNSKLAGFLKHNMPLGQGGSLTDNEAIDLAAYINSQPRPDFPDKHLDWPKGDKPADAPY